MTRPSKITAANRPLTGSTGTAVPPVTAVPDTFAGDPPNFIELGYGMGPRCIECRRNLAGCLCNYPEPEAEYFRPGINRDPDNCVLPLPSGWQRIEL